MSSNITKILIRQGNNIVRTVTPGVLFDVGEPAFTLDTKRLYVGDGATVGGISIGMKNWGTITNIFSSAQSYNAIVLPVVSAFEAGDIVYESSSQTLYYAISTNPTAFQWGVYALSNTINGFNGIAASTYSNILSVGLGAGFTVSDVNQSILLNYNTTLNFGKNLTLNSGIITVTTGNSNNWSSVYTNVNTNSASWSLGYSNVNANSAAWNNANTSGSVFAALSSNLPKAWGYFDGSRFNTSTKVVSALFASYNISQIIRLSQGVYNIQFTSNLPSINYAVIGSGICRLDPNLGNTCVSEYWPSGSTYVQSASTKNVSNVTIQSLDSDSANRAVIDSVVSFNIFGY